MPTPEDPDFLANYLARGDASERVAKAGLFLDELGLLPLSPQEIEESSQAYARQLLSGSRDKDPFPDSLKMIDTLLRPVSRNELRLHQNQEVLVLEIGGTKIRGARARADANGNVSFNERDDYRETDLPITEFPSPENFVTTVLSGEITQLLGRERQVPQALAIIYAFPSKVVSTEHGVDVISPEKLPKNFFIKDIDKRPVGEWFLDELMGSYPEFTGLHYPVVVLNDTPAVLLSTESRIGGVVGTGFNFAVSINGIIYNIECGGFRDVPWHKLIEAIDSNEELIKNRGLQRTEKQVAGKYLGLQLEEAIRQLAARGLLSLKPRAQQEITAVTISQILAYNKEAVAEVLEGELDNTTFAILTNVAERLRERSAGLVSMLLGTKIKTFPAEFLPEDEKVTVPIDGSVFWDMPGYRRLVKAQAQKISHRLVDFPYQPHAGMKGAAAATFGLLPRS